RFFAGTAGKGLFEAVGTPTVRTLPVVLDVTGATGARFHSELTLGNRGPSDDAWRVTFTPAPPTSPALQANVPIPAPTAPPAPAGTEVRATDALAYLRSLGLGIPPPPVTGSLTFDAGDASSLYAFSRTYTSDANGSYGVILDAPGDLEAAEEEGAIYGLRSIAG